jgi:hypothetical protein
MPSDAEDGVGLEPPLAWKGVSPAVRLCYDRMFRVALSRCPLTQSRP